MFGLKERVKRLEDDALAQAIRDKCARNIHDWIAGSVDNRLQVWYCNVSPINLSAIPEINIGHYIYCKHCCKKMPPEQYDRSSVDAPKPADKVNSPSHEE